MINEIVGNKALSMPSLEEQKIIRLDYDIYPHSPIGKDQKFISVHKRVRSISFGMFEEDCSPLNDEILILQSNVDMDQDTESVGMASVTSDPVHVSSLMDWENLGCAEDSEDLASVSCASLAPSTVSDDSYDLTGEEDNCLLNRESCFEDLGPLHIHPDGAGAPPLVIQNESWRDSAQWDTLDLDYALGHL